MTGEFSPNHLYKLLSFLTEGGTAIYNLKLIYVAPASELSGIKPMLYSLSQASLRLFRRSKGSPPSQCRDKHYVCITYQGLYAYDLIHI